MSLRKSLIEGNGTGLFARATHHGVCHFGQIPNTNIVWSAVEKLCPCYWFLIPSSFKQYSNIETVVGHTLQGRVGLPSRKHLAFHSFLMRCVSSTTSADTGSSECVRIFFLPLTTCYIRKVLEIVRFSVSIFY